MKAQNSDSRALEFNHFVIHPRVIFIEHVYCLGNLVLEILRQADLYEIMSRIILGIVL